MKQHAPPSKKVMLSPTHTVQPEHTLSHLVLEATRLWEAKPPLIQTYPTWGIVTESFEQQAERGSNSVMQMIEPVSQCRVRPEKNKDDCKQTTKPGEHMADSLQEIRGVPRQAGKRQSEIVQNLTEPCFGYSLGDIRVHSDDRGSASPQALLAHAYTLGNSNVFDTHRYAPKTTSER